MSSDARTDAPSLSTLDAALALARLGLRTWFAHGIIQAGDGFACACGDTRDGHRDARGKHPLGRLWQNRASTDAQALRDAYVPGCNVGVVCGEQPDGRYVVAIDVDDPARLASLVTDFGALPPTLTGYSPRGARYFLTSPEPLTNVSGVGKSAGVDLRAKGGFCVVGPSRHKTGAYYTWDDLRAPLAEIPASWLALVRPPAKIPQALSSWAPTDKRARTRAEAWARKILDGECQILARSAEGTRNTVLYYAALRAIPPYVGAQLGAHEPHSALVSAARACGLPELESRRTLASAQKYIDDNGLRRTPPDRTRLSLVSPAGSAGSAGSSEAEPLGPELIDDNGAPAKIAENVARMLAIYPGGAPRLDSFSSRIKWPDGRDYLDTDDLAVQGWLFAQPHAQRVRAGVEAVRMGIEAYAAAHAYHPVRAFLAGLTWDQRPRVDRLFVDYFGAADSPYVRAAARCFLLGAVARIQKPGCKLDTMPVLEGGTGFRKSTGLAALAGVEWFSDSNLAVGEKDGYQDLVGVWIYELSELSSLRGRDVERVKAYISSQVDHYRPSYGRRTINAPRQVAFVGSTNDSHYLRDTTGNRRYHPIRCGSSVHVEGLREDRAELWAEALTRYGAGESWWLDGELVLQQAAAAEQCRVRHPWEDRVPNLPADLTDVTMSELLVHMGVDVGRQTHADDSLLAPILRRFGWTPHRRRVAGQPTRLWLREPPLAR